MKNIDRNVILVPTGDGKNFRKSVIEGINYNKIRHLVGSGCNVNGLVRMWDTSLMHIYDKIKKGDYVLFYRKKQFIYVAEIISKVQSSELSEYVWGGGKGNIYTLGKLTPVNYSFGSFRDLVGYQDNYFLLKSIYLSKERLKRIIQKHGSIDSFITGLKSSLPKPSIEREKCIYISIVEDYPAKDKVKVKIGLSTDVKTRLKHHKTYGYIEDVVFDIEEKLNLRKIETVVLEIAERYDGKKKATEIFEFYEKHYKEFKSLLSLLFRKRDKV